MANPTTQVTSAIRNFGDESCLYPLISGATNAKTYQTGQLMGRRTDGYATDLDDSASLEFIGLVFGAPLQVDAGDASGAKFIRVHLPRRFTMPLSSGTASRATDIGKTVYAYDAGKVIISPAALTYANPVGRITDVFGSAANSLTGAHVEIEPFTTNRNGGALFTAAAITLTRNDLNKTVFVANTGAITITLPAVAQTCPGDFLRFVKTTAAAEIVTLDGASSETIDNATTYTAIDARYDCATLVSTGSEWVIRNRDIA